MSGGAFKQVAAAVALGAVLGLASAALAIRNGGHVREVRNGVWTASLLAGSRDAGLHARAGYAVAGLMALRREEAVYFRAAVDEDGETLSGDCSYRVEGSDPAARWWSLTAYGSDRLLIPNEVGLYSFNKTTAPTTADGSRSIEISATDPGRPWLPVARGRPFDLILRLYEPAGSVLAEPDAAVLPRVIREHCP